MPSWIRMALEPGVVRRALLFAAIVGPVLIAINHWDAILRGDIEPGRLLKMALTVAVPYLVSTFSSVGALRRLRGPSSQSGPHRSARDG